ncbi:MAG: glyoxalase [Alphaproteobacteria bacterium]|nr:glyoxalase [Alphaproteobacteria bacterium]
MAVTKLQNAYYLTRDMDRAVAFWRDALGLELRFQDGSKWAQLRLGDSSIALSTPEEGAPEAVGATLVLETDDLVTARRAVEAHGGTVIDERKMGSGVAITFRDPDGNIVQLYQRAAK